MSTTTQPPKPKRRWYQFSLLTLLVVMVVSCFGFAWIGWRMQRAQDNRARMATSEKEIERVATAIEELRGTYVREYEARPPTWLEGLFDDPGGRDDPVRVLMITRVSLSYKPGVTDDELEQLQVLKNLRFLRLTRISVGDSGLVHLKDLTNLKRLNLEGDKVTDAGLEHLKGLTNLEELDLRGTNVTDEGVKKLQQALPNCVIRY